MDLLGGLLIIMVIGIVFIPFKYGKELCGNAGGIFMVAQVLTMVIAMCIGPIALYCVWMPLDIIAAIIFAKVNGLM